MGLTMAVALVARSVQAKAEVDRPARQGAAGAAGAAGALRLLP